VESLASIFVRKYAPFAETSILGLREQPSSTEPWEPPPQADSAPSTEELPAFVEPWEPPPMRIEFSARPAAEFAAEIETQAAEQPLPTVEPPQPEPSQPGNESPPDSEADPDDPLWPPRA
jgi:hypothetical protein